MKKQALRVVPDAEATPEAVPAEDPIDVATREVERLATRTRNAVEAVTQARKNELATREKFDAAEVDVGAYVASRELAESRERVRASCAEAEQAARAKLSSLIHEKTVADYERFKAQAQSWPERIGPMLDAARTARAALEAVLDAAADLCAEAQGAFDQAITCEAAARAIVTMRSAGIERLDLTTLKVIVQVFLAVDDKASGRDAALNGWGDAGREPAWNENPAREAWERAAALINKTGSAA